MAIRKKTSKQLANLQEYRRIRKNIQNKISYYKKQGLNISIKLPTVTANPTKKDINKLNKITTNTLLKSADVTKSTRKRRQLRWVDVGTGEMHTGRAPKDVEAYINPDTGKLVTRKPKKKVNTNDDFFSDVIITNFRAEYSQFPRSKGVFDSWLNGMIDRLGKRATAQMLQEGRESGLLVTQDVAYNEALRAEFFMSMLEFAPEIGQMSREEIAEELDEYNFYSEEY